MQYHVVPYNTMQYHVVLCNTVQYHSIPCNTVQYHAIPCNTKQYHAIPCNTMYYHAISGNTMQYHAISCTTMQYYASLITAAYHWPVGSIRQFLAQKGALIAILTYYWCSTHQLFHITPVLNTKLSLSEPFQLYQGQSLDSSAGYMYTLWVQQGITAR